MEEQTSSAIRSPDPASAGTLPAIDGRIGPRSVQVALLAQAGRLLLEYNESTATIHRVLKNTSEALTGERCDIAVFYGGVTISLAGESPVMRPVSELRYNTALQAQIRRILEQVRRHEIAPAAALACLETVEADTPQHPRRLAVPVLGIAAAALAGLLGADAVALMIASVSTALGLIARKELGRRGCSPLVLPLVASLIGAILGGVTVRFGWTRTPELVLIVPALMVVPGPHFINGLLDLFDNHVPTSLARLGLAAGILLASTLGVILGIGLTLPAPHLTQRGVYLDDLELISKTILAGVVTCGFAVFYNATWRQVAMAAVGGMAGNGIREIALDANVGLAAATFMGGIAVGLVSAAIARFAAIPVAVIAFAGAVTMMPGVDIYSALGGTLQLARLTDTPNPVVTIRVLSQWVQVCLVTGGLTLGLISGAQVASPPRHG